MPGWETREESNMLTSNSIATVGRVRNGYDEQLRLSALPKSESRGPRCTQVTSGRQFRRAASIKYLYDTQKATWP